MSHDAPVHRGRLFSGLKRVFPDKKIGTQNDSEYIFYRAKYGYNSISCYKWKKTLKTKHRRN